MKAILLAGGRGNRLRPITDSVPKSLVEVGGQTILDRAIETFRECGIEEVVVSAGYLIEQVEAAVKKYGDFVSVVDVGDYTNTDNMYGTFVCKEKCDADDLIIMNADTIISKELVKQLADSNDSVMPVVMNPDLKDGQIVLIYDGVVRGIGKRLPHGHGTAINMFKFSKKDVGVLYQHMDYVINNLMRPKDWIEVAIHEISRKIDIRPLDVEGNHWLEIDDLEDLASANDFFDKGIYAHKSQNLLRE